MSSVLRGKLRETCHNVLQKTPMKEFNKIDAFSKPLLINKKNI